MPTPILPNGVPHGICSDGDEKLYLCNYGEFISFNRYLKKSIINIPIVRFTKNFRIIKYINNNDIHSIKITLIFDQRKYINGSNCLHCDKIHIIKFRSLNGIVHLVSECYKPTMFIKTNYNLRKLKLIYFKPSLRSRVVKYARSLTN